MCNPTPPDGGACNSLTASGPVVTLECSAATLPAPTGGTIVDGTYTMTSATFYGPDCPATEQDQNTWLVCGSTWQTVQVSNTEGQGTTVNTFDLNVLKSGSSLRLQVTCGGSNEMLIFPYSATATTLSLYISQGASAGTGRIDVYTLQP
jgi:hypothetical protein